MFSSIGILKYFNNPHKLIVEIDPEISNFYRSLIPKSIYINKQRYPAHISVVRKELPINQNFWEKYQNKELIFKYDSFIFNNSIYFWLRAQSNILESIRLELGLSNTSIYTKSPDGQHNFHITLGNVK